MTCKRCNGTGLAACPFDGQQQECPDCDKEPATQADPADMAMLAVREDAEVLRRHSTHHSEFVLAAIARAATAQALLVERMTWAMESIVQAAVGEPANEEATNGEA
ncbi:MAG: hypothetical protein U0840_25555 [Gemmataceae bacterium]